MPLTLQQERPMKAPASLGDLLGASRGEYRKLPALRGDIEGGGLVKLPAKRMPSEPLPPGMTPEMAAFAQMGGNEAERMPLRTPQGNQTIQGQELLVEGDWNPPQPPAPAPAPQMQVPPSPPIPEAPTLAPPAPPPQGLAEALAPPAPAPQAAAPEAPAPQPMKPVGITPPSNPIDAAAMLNAVKGGDTSSALDGLNLNALARLVDHERAVTGRLSGWAKIDRNKEIKKIENKTSGLLKSMLATTGPKGALSYQKHQQNILEENNKAKNRIELLGYQQAFGLTKQSREWDRKAEENRKNRLVKVFQTQASQGGQDRRTALKVAQSERNLLLKSSAALERAAMLARERGNVAAADRLSRESIAAKKMELGWDKLLETESGKDRRLGVTEAGKGQRLDVTEAGKGQRLEVQERGRNLRLGEQESGRNLRLGVQELGRGRRLREQEAGRDVRQARDLDLRERIQDQNLDVKVGMQERKIDSQAALQRDRNMFTQEENRRKHQERLELQRLRNMGKVRAQKVGARKDPREITKAIDGIAKEQDEHNDALNGIRYRNRMNRELQSYKLSNPAILRADRTTREALLNETVAAVQATGDRPSDMRKFFNAFWDKAKRKLTKNLVGGERDEVIRAIDAMEGFTASAVADLSKLGAKGRTAYPDEQRIARSLLGLIDTPDKAYAQRIADVTSYATTVGEKFNSIEKYIPVLDSEDDPRGTRMARRQTQTLVNDINQFTGHSKNIFENLKEERDLTGKNFKLNPQTKKKIARFYRFSLEWDQVNKKNPQEVIEFLRENQGLGVI